ncbi:MAG: FMN-binding glutamate synthase family protein [Bacillota bacterium]|nr:FMN-binding glutamate synthase family protein [Bacillota bacterium]
MGLVDWFVNTLVDSKMKRIMKEPYTDSLINTVTTLQKVNARILVETLMRAKQGKPVGRPFGSVLQMSPWEHILLSPTYLTRVPPKYGTPIDLRVTIGPRAKKPLQIEIPVMVTGMSFGGALSVRAKVALARAASRAGTATNTGEAFLPEEREAADKLIVQYIRGTWPASSQYRWDQLEQADAIEIQVGQGAQAGVAQTTPAKKIHERMREAYGLDPGQDALIESQLEGVKGAQDLERLVRKLKERFPVPIGYKFGATQWMERELEIAIRAGVDYIVVDGAEAGTHAAPPTLADDTGLPTFHALVRTVDYLERRGVREDVSVIAAGGLRTPGEFLKALALGADAVYIGTIAVLAMLADEMAKTAPGEPATQLVLQTGSRRRDLDVEQAAQNLYNFFKAVEQEMRQGIAAVGKTRVADLKREDLVALDESIAAFAGIPSAWRPSPASMGPAGELVQTWVDGRAAAGAGAGAGVGAGAARAGAREADARDAAARVGKAATGAAREADALDAAAREADAVPVRD